MRRGNEADGAPVALDVARLEKELRMLRGRLKAGAARKPDKKPEKKKRKTSAGKRRARRRMGRVALAPGYVATTVPGSLYSTILNVLAQRGKLALQEYFFNRFARKKNEREARKLLAHIGVSRADLERRVRADEAFLEHCLNHTRSLKNRAAQGDERAKSALANRSRCAPGGRWVGNIEEAIATLYGARNEKQLLRGKNVRILKRIGLMFNAEQRNGECYCYLYPRKRHRLFRQALRLAGSE